MLKLKKMNVVAMILAAMALQLAGCSGNDSKPDYTVKTEATKADPPKKVKEEKKREEEEDDDDERKEKAEASESSEANEALSNKGIGPIKHVELGELDQAMADEGKVIYEKMCTSCHKPTRRFVGPAQKGVLERRSPEWVMNMILNPEQMVKEDPIAKALLVEYNLSPMANQHLTEEEARKVLEYFRTL